MAITAAAGSGSNVGSGLSWANPSGITDEEGSHVATVLGTGTSKYLTSSSHDFSAISVGATILGIQARYVTYVLTGATTENVISLTKDGITPVGDNKASVSWNLSPFQSNIRGGAADLWGTTWTRADITASTFGLMIKVDLVSDGANVDYVELTVTYMAGDNDEAAVMATSRIQISQRFKAA